MINFDFVVGLHAGGSALRPASSRYAISIFNPSFTRSVILLAASWKTLPSIC